MEIVSRLLQESSIENNAAGLDHSLFTVTKNLKFKSIYFHGIVNVFVEL